MDAAYVTAFAALGGSIVGSATSLMTTFLTQNNQRRVDRASKEADRHEKLYGEFIDEVSRRSAAGRTISP